MTPALLLEMFRVAWVEARAYLLRSMVTILAVAAAVFSVVLLASLARSGTSSLKRGIEDIGGARLIAVFEKPSDKRRAGIAGRSLSLEDADAIRARVAHVQHVAAVAPLGSRLVRSGQATPRAADLLGGNADMLEAFAMPLVAGRNISLEDLRERRPVTILGHDICSMLFASCERAIGQLVRIGSQAFRVVGAVARIERFGANLGFDWNAFALIPATVAAVPPRVLLVLTDGAAFHEQVQSTARRLLEARHGFADDVDVFDFGRVIEGFFTVFRTMEWLVSLLAGIALVVAAFGIVNAQLASFRQRILDSGIRLALGAPRAALGAQMLFESASLALVGAALGSVLGIALSAVAGALIAGSHPGWVSVVASDTAAGACVAALVVGSLAGLLPARRAFGLDVVECLRAQ